MDIHDASGANLLSIPRFHAGRVLMSFDVGDRVAIADVLDGDGVDELVVVHHDVGRGSEITIHNEFGAVRGGFGGFVGGLPYEPGDGFAVGDVLNGDGIAEITVAHKDPHGGPRVTIYDAAGSVRGSFGGFASGLAYEPGDGFAVGDVLNGDGIAEIIVAHKDPHGGPRVTIYDAAGSVRGSFGGFASGLAYEPGDGFAVGFSGDKDGDALLDSWEAHGIDYDGDARVDLDLPLAGASPSQKDLFVEIDYFDCTIGSGDCTPGDNHSHRPGAAALVRVQNSYANAPVPNPGGPNGIALHVDVDEQLVHRQFCELDGTCFDQIKRDHFGTQAERSSLNSENILAAKRLAYRYNLWVHQRAAGTGSSGRAEAPGNDFVISLGAAFNQVGTADTQAGAFMHELGHTLGLRHGGTDSINCKPNYLSVMSYAFNFGLLPAPRFDYSRRALPDLDEGSLDETVGIQDDALISAFGPPANLDGIDQPTAAPDGDITDDLLHAPGVGPIDWNNNGGSNDTGVSADINNLEFTDCESSPGQTLRGASDWDRLVYGFRHTRSYPEGEHDFAEIEEPDVNTLQNLKERIRDATQWRFEYPAKIVCGVQPDSGNTRLTRGLYATSINIHNPHKHRVQIAKKLALSHPPKEQAAGESLTLGADALGPDQALKIDCEILAARLFPRGLPTSFIEGFVVVRSRKSLDVQAVYSAAALDPKGAIAQQSSLDIERVPERLVEQEADLEVWTDQRIDARQPLTHAGSGLATVTYTIFVVNHGPAPAANVTVRELVSLRGGILIALPENELKASHSGRWVVDHSGIADAGLRALIPRLEAGQTATLQIAVHLAPDTQQRRDAVEITSTVIVGSETAESIVDNNTSIISLRSRGGAGTGEETTKGRRNGGVIRE
jgi:hypothetical protein